MSSLFQHEIQHITAQQVIDVAKRYGWKEVESKRENILLIEDPQSKTVLILCEPGVFTDERRVMQSAIEHFALWLLDREISNETT